MDHAVILVFRSMVPRFRCSAEDILEDPEFRNTFLKEVRLLIGDIVSERQLLHRLSSLRKGRKLPRMRDIMALANISPLVQLS